MSFIQALQNIKNSLQKEESIQAQIKSVFESQGIILGINACNIREGILFVVATPLQKKQIYQKKESLLQGLKKINEHIKDII